MVQKGKKTVGRPVRKSIWRVGIYVLGLMSLAAGISMNTMTGLGVSPIVSVPYAVSQLWNLNFADATMVFYILFVLLQFVIKGKKSTPVDLLQIVLSILFTRFMNLFSNLCWIDYHNVPEQALILVGAVVFTGIGVAMSTSMRLIPNPGDGIVQALSDRLGTSMGFMKNAFDCSCMVIALIIGFLFGHRVIGIGIGTVAAMLGTGRVVAVFQHFFLKKMLRRAGLKR